MKLYKNLVDAVALTVQDIFKGKRYADKALEKMFKSHPQWGSRDRKFVAEGVYEIVRNYRLYAHLAESENNFWFITAVWLVVRGTELPQWQEFQHVNANAILQNRESLREEFVYNESIPDWLYELMTKELGEDLTRRELLAMNQQAPVFLRVNTIKCSVNECLAELEKDGMQVERVSEAPFAIRLLKRENVFQHRLFKDGWFEVQDAGSQIISQFLDPQAGEVVIDACAGAGGKSLHLAALMKNKGRIISMDLEAWKLDELKKRSRRANAHNIETRVIEKDTTIAGLEKKADKLLLDVPCSGLGVLKRNPDAKWKLDLAVIEKTKLIQADILNAYCSMLKPNGIMVYSTCSILPSENTEQVKRFLKSHPHFELLEERSIMPSEGFDGFYMARLKRTT